MQPGMMEALAVVIVAETAMQAEPFPASFQAAVAHSRVMNAGYVTDATQRFTALAPAQQALITRHLDALAKLPATTAGVSEALPLLRQQVDTFPIDPHNTGSGRTPAQVAMHRAGMCVVHGRVAETADAVKGTPESAAELLRVIRTAQALSGSDRTELLRELQLAFGREAFAQANERVSSSQGARP
jgi:hypothetical protein